MERRGLIIRSVWAACLLVAGLNHARILIRHGLFWDYEGASQASALYWSSLTLIDPMVAALLFVRPRVGMPATLVLIVTNVAHNLSVITHNSPEGAYVSAAFSSPQMMSQIGFLIFVIATWRLAWPGIGGDMRGPDRGTQG